MNKLSFINPNSKIGKDSVIEPFSYIDENVIVGNLIPAGTGFYESN